MTVPDAGDQRPLIAHVVYRFDIGGLENGVVNLINHLPEERFRHAVICLTDYTAFSRRLNREGVSLHALHKRPGKDLALYGRLWRLFRRLRPSIVHTRNLASLEAQAVAAAARVPARVHGEHGWDISDLTGTRSKSRLIRRCLRPFVHQYIALSADIRSYLTGPIGVPSSHVSSIHNGVDTARFAPGERPAWRASVFGDGGLLVFGTVGRLQSVKDHATLLRAFARLRQSHPSASSTRLVIVGDGPLRDELDSERRRLGLTEVCWFAGECDDVPEMLRGIDVFVLPSLAEGICNTVLEAMACGLPVIATAVGGNPELVVDGETGHLVAPADPEVLAKAMGRYLADPALIAAHGHAGRLRVLADFSLQTMVERYTSIYDRLLAGDGGSWGARGASRGRAGDRTEGG